MAKTLILKRRVGDVLVAAFNRPESLNALSTALMKAIERFSREMIDDPARVLIFKGSGQHFSAGADLKQPPADPAPLVQRRRDQMHGVALGGGLCIATACDFRVAARNASAGYPEINLGMNLMWQSIGLCQRLVGISRAKRMVMLGERLDAPTLADWGLIDELCELENLDQVALNMAERYAAQPPIATQMIKQTLNQIAGALDAAILHMDTDQNLLTATTEDRRQAMLQFLTKSPATYNGD
jgi:enoyl-CoA hydratase/carnithine racemase